MRHFVPPPMKPDAPILANIRIVNRFNFAIKVSLLGGKQDPMATSANANTEYRWDLTLENFQGDKDKVTLQFKPSGAAAWQTITKPLKQQSWYGFIEALNSMLLGFFFQDGVYLVTCNDTYEFGNVSITG